MTSKKNSNVKREYTLSEALNYSFSPHLKVNINNQLVYKTARFFSVIAAITIIVNFSLPFLGIEMFTSANTIIGFIAIIQAINLNANHIAFKNIPNSWYTIPIINEKLAKRQAIAMLLLGIILLVI